MATNLLEYTPFHFYEKPSGVFEVMMYASYPFFYESKKLYIILFFHRLSPYSVLNIQDSSSMLWDQGTWNGQSNGRLTKCSMSLLGAIMSLLRVPQKPGPFSPLHRPGGVPRSLTYTILDGKMTPLEAAFSVSYIEVLQCYFCHLVSVSTKECLSTSSASVVKRPSPLSTSSSGTVWGE